MMILKYGRSVAAFGMMVLALCASPVFASNDAIKELLKVLRDNGTISEQAYSVLKNSVDADAERTHAEMEKTTDQRLAKYSAGGW